LLKSLLLGLASTATSLVTSGSSFLKNYVAGTWLEFIKTLEGANDDLVVANTGVLVPNVEGSLESSKLL
jgi:hypothetical protein